MTPEERQAARARCEVATEGPWELSPYARFEAGGTLLVCPDTEGGMTWLGRILAPEQGPGRTEMLLTHDSSDSLIADGEFIAHARTDLPAALDEIDRLEAENERLRDALRRIASWSDQLDNTDRTGLLRMVAEGLAMEGTQ